MSKYLFLILSAFLLSISFTSALLVDADYITIFPGEQGTLNINVENNENFDIEEVSINLVLASVSSTGQIISLPFTVIGGNQKDLDDLDEDDDDSVSFTIKATSGIEPGDYNIPYVITYYEQGENEKLQSQGSFGIRVSAKTDIDFASELENNILNKQGKISIEIINKGLGEIKAVSVEIIPEGYELISKEKIFIGNIDAEDFDVVNYDVIFKNQNPTLSAKVNFKDFENKDQTEIINIPLKVYTEEEALQRGLIKKSNLSVYIITLIILIVIFFVYRGFRKNKNKRKKKEFSEE